MLDPKNVPAGTSNSGDKEKDVIGDTPATKPIILLPKKRPYGGLQIEPEEKQITPIMKIVEKQTKEVKEVTASSQTEPLRNQSEVTDKKSQEPELAAFDKPNVKPARETRKKQSQKASKSEPSTSQPSTSQASTSKASTSKASTSRASTSKASTSKASTSRASTSKASTSKAPTTKASTSKASKEAGSNLKSGNKPSASKSEASSSTENRINDSHFWVDTVMSKFRSNDYKNLLRESSFTESQADALQNFFYKSCRKLYNVSVNSNRVMRKHKCQDCPFSIEHQCVSINFLHVGLANSNVEPTTFIAPETIIICLCQFAFFHDHITRPSCSKTDTEGPKLTPDPVRESRDTRLRCDLCDTILIIKHSLVGNTDCMLTRWSGVNSSNEKKFHAHLVDYLKPFTKRRLSLEELYTCNYNCCLFFHRCNE
ncbi:uncharacterized protein LOC119830892 [Zerene cesonia]|uniref:uncharacterized protein LOC119830892 n=1 Tax=Zerene cesonia TaxID=33412 RepID=UPI0018E4E65A|nr:uncharacterized protein LOC119830892 [Zerene cesonia]